MEASSTEPAMDPTNSHFKGSWLFSGDDVWSWGGEDIVPFGE